MRVPLAGRERATDTDPIVPPGARGRETRGRHPTSLVRGRWDRSGGAHAGSTDLATLEMPTFALTPEEFPCRPRPHP